MSANKIAETSTSTGTGSFTLDGAWSQAGTFNTGNRTFNSFFGLTQYFPYMIQDTAGNWEKGRGYLSAASTLVRAYVLDNSLGTQALINFPSGSKLVMVPTEADSLGIDNINNVNWWQSPIATGTKTTQALTANQLWLNTLFIPRPMLIQSVGVNVTTAVASTNVRLGLYNLTKQPDGGNTYDTIFPLIADFGTIDSGTTGNKSISANLKLGRGVYFSAFISNGAPTLTASSSAYSPLNGVGSMGDPNSRYLSTNAAYFTALPTVTPNAMTGQGGSLGPTMFFRGTAL